MLHKKYFIDILFLFLFLFSFSLASTTLHLDEWMRAELCKWMSADVTGQISIHRVTMDIAAHKDNAIEILFVLRTHHNNRRRFDIPFLYRKFVSLDTTTREISDRMQSHLIFLEGMDMVEHGNSYLDARICTLLGHTYMWNLVGKLYTQLVDIHTFRSLRIFCPLCSSVPVAWGEWKYRTNDLFLLTKQANIFACKMDFAHSSVFCNEDIEVKSSQPIVINEGLSNFRLQPESNNLYYAYSDNGETIFHLTLYEANGSATLEEIQSNVDRLIDYIPNVGSLNVDHHLHLMHI